MSLLSGLFSGNSNKGPSYEKKVVGAFGETVGALQRKEEGDKKKEEEKKKKKKGQGQQDMTILEENTYPPHRVR